MFKGSSSCMYSLLNLAERRRQTLLCQRATVTIPRAPQVNLSEHHMTSFLCQSAVGKLLCIRAPQQSVTVTYDLRLHHFEFSSHSKSQRCFSKQHSNSCSSESRLKTFYGCTNYCLCVEFSPWRTSHQSRIFLCDSQRHYELQQHLAWLFESHTGLEITVLRL